MASHSKDTVFRAIAADFDISLPERFEQIAQMYPNRIAVKTRTGGITYSALNRTANRIGRAVLERIGSDSEPVALLLEKGIDLIAALIGVLKAGKFFVAIDPSFPRLG